MSIADRSRSASLRRAFVALGALVLLAFAPPAHAGDKALAESLFQEGRRLMAEGKNEEACKRFEGSQAQDPSPGTLINLGHCSEALGRTASAWAHYKQAEALARNMGRAEQEQLAGERAAALEPKLSKLRIDPPSVPIEGLVVTRAGVELARESLGVGAPIDPGSYVIEARAPGRKTWTHRVMVRADGSSAVVTIPDLERAPASRGVAAQPGKDAGRAVDITSDTERPDYTIHGWVLIGVGGAAIIAGGIAGVMVFSQASNAEDDPKLCPDKQCSPEGRAEIDSAEDKALFATIAIPAGVVAAGAGAVLVLTSASSKRRDKTAVAPLVGNDRAGLVVTGAF